MQMRQSSIRDKFSLRSLVLINFQLWESRIDEVRRLITSQIQPLNLMNLRDVNTNITKKMWQPNQNVTGCKSRGAPIMRDAMLPDKKNTIYHFMLKFISLTKTQQSLLCFQHTGTVINHRETKSCRVNIN